MRRDLIQRSREIRGTLQTIVDVSPLDYTYVVNYPLTANLPETDIILEGKSRIASSGIYITASPYCPTVCLYCPYTAGKLRNQSQLDDYLGILEWEVQMVLSRTPINKVTSVYFGGGTPSLLSYSQLKRLLNFVNSHFNIQEGSEVSFEINPNTIIDYEGNRLPEAEEKLDLLRRQGVNRVSVGIQTFDDEVLKAVHRRHSSEQAKRAYELIRGYFENINIDLMHGLPDQTLELWEQDLIRVCELDVPSITVYQTRLHHPDRYETRRTGLASLYQRYPERFPTSEDNLLMRIMATEHFTQNRYLQNLVNWFVKTPKRDQQQQKAKWHGGNLLGFGPRAYSYVDGEAFVNQSGVSNYSKALESGKLAVQRGKRLSEDEIMRRTIIFALKSSGLDIYEFQKRFGVSPLDGYSTILSKLMDEGLVQQDGRIIHLTYNGALFADAVVKRFF